MPIKVAVIGAGSIGFTRRLMRDILSVPELADCEFAFHDLNKHNLDMIVQLAARDIKANGLPAKLSATTHRRRALEGADYVVVTISTGGLEAMRVDLEVPEKYGIFQTVGDTVGPGGASRNLRNIPVFLHLARAMEEHCPQAWMLNCSNPLTALTRAVDKETGIRAIGLCHGVVGQVRQFATFFDAALEDCAYVNTGIDHCAWITDLKIGGRCAQEMLLERGVDEWLAKPAAAAREDEVFLSLYNVRCGLMLWRQLGALPGIGDRHMVEFFPTFLQGVENVERYGLQRTSIAERQAGRQRARQRLEQRLADEAEMDLAEGSDNVAGWIAALDGGPVVEDNLNAPNIGQIPQLSPGAVVETRGLLDATGYRPLASPMPRQIEAIVAPHVARQELLVEAAVEGNFDKAVAALASDPLVGRADAAREMLQEMVEGTRQWLSGDE